MGQVNVNFNKVVSILMPAYNEAQNIEKVVCKCIETLDKLKLKGEVVVTNDGSIDNTKDILNNLKKEITNLVVVHHEKNMGYGAALYNAINASKGDIIVTIDSDGQFNIEELPLLLNLYQKGYKIVAGFRKEKKDSFLKVLANKILSLLTNCMFGLKLKDANCAFKLYEGSLIRALKIESKGFQTPTEILVKFKILGYPIGEVGIAHSFREKGKSALGLVRTTMDMLSFFIYLKLRVYLYKKKIINTV